MVICWLFKTLDQVFLFHVVTDVVKSADKSGFLFPEFGQKSLELLFPHFLSEDIKISQALKILTGVLMQPKQ